METYAVRNITKLRNEAPQSSDVLSDILRKGAQTLLQQAIEAEVQSYLSRINGSQSLVVAVRNGYSPERTIQTGVGDVLINQPRARVKKGYEGIEHFSSKILPPYLRRTKSLDELTHGCISRGSPPVTSKRHCRRYWVQMLLGYPRPL